MLIFIAAIITLFVVLIGGILKNKSEIAKTVDENDHNYIAIGIVIWALMVFINFMIASNNGWNFYYLVELF